MTLDMHRGHSGGRRARRLRLRDSEVTVATALAADSPTVIGDRIGLQQVLVDS